MDTVNKFLLLAFSLGLTCLLIAYFGRAADAGLNTSDIAIEKLNEYNSLLSESDIMMYDGLVVTGSDVVNFIKKNLGEYEADEEASIHVHVSTNISSNTYSNGAIIKELQDFSSEKYIKPVARFLCLVQRNENGVINGIEFLQR